MNRGIHRHGIGGLRGALVGVHLGAGDLHGASAGDLHGVGVHHGVPDGDLLQDGIRAQVGDRNLKFHLPGHPAHMHTPVQATVFVL